MTRLLALWILICATVALLLPGIPARAEEPAAASEAAAEPPSRPALRRAVSVADDVVRLSDLFEHLGPARDRPVAYAPQPGRSAVLNAERLRDIAIRYRLQWRPRHFDRVVVTRSSQVIRAEAVVDEIQAMLRERGYGEEELWVNLDNRSMTIHLPTDVSPSFMLKGFQFDERTGRFSASLRAPADAPLAVKPVTGEVYRVAEVPTLARRVKKGEVIAESDVEWVKMRADRVGRNVITEADDIIGMAPRRMLRPGGVIRVSDVHKPVVIGRGAIVMMRYQTRFMTLTARARALEDGNMGGTIRVMNIQSKKTIEAEVVNSDIVVVTGTGGLVLNR